MTAAPFTLSAAEWDREQVRPYLEAFAAVRAELDPSGTGIAYDADFIGRVPGIAGSPHETRAIYLLQTLWSVEREAERVALMLAQGYREIEAPDVPTRYERVVLYHEGRYVGGTGSFAKYCDARVAADPARVIPKGKRNGYDARSARIFVFGGPS